MRHLVVVVLASALAAVACGSPAAAPAGGASGGPGNVVVKEWAIEPKSIPAAPGKVTFTVKNTGNIEHNFDITGIGKIDSILAGETKTLTVDLKAGTYDVVCSLAGHKEAGMVGKLVVGK